MDAPGTGGGWPAYGAAVGWGVAAWVACGLAAELARVAFGLDAAMEGRMAAAPLVSAATTVLCWNHARHPGPIATAALLAGVPAGLDALLAAAMPGRGLAAPASLLSAWVAMLAFLSSLVVARHLARPPERRAFLGWMATPEEQREPLPGDRWLPVEHGSTHAIGIAAPPEAVWPWLAQMGLGRAGWYSHDRLDNWGHRSAEEIRPELQSVAAGDRWRSTPDGRTWFEVLEADPGRHLVLGFHMTTGPMRSLPWSEASPAVHQRATWSFALRPAGESACRLQVRGRAASRPAWRWLPWAGFFWLAHVVMQRKQLLGIRRRAERSVRAGAAAGPAGSGPGR